LNYIQKQASPWVPSPPPASAATRPGYPEPRISPGAASSPLIEQPALPPLASTSPPMHHTCYCSDHPDKKYQISFWKVPFFQAEPI